MAEAVRPTLGPIARTVAVQDVRSGRPIEVLDDAATILRRVIEIPDVYVNMGAMLLRHSVWKTFEAVGDGGATTAVLFQALMRHLSPYVAAGGDPVALRRHLDRGLAAATAALRDQARPLNGPDEIARAALTLCHDAELAEMLGEIFDIVGTDGYLQVEDGYAPGLERQYVEGIHWNQGYLSAYFITDEVKQEVRLELPMILISDLRITAAEELIPLLDRAVEAKAPGLVVIAEEVSGSALGLLLANHRQGTLRSMAVKTPTYEPHRSRILEDLAVLTGGQVVSAESGQRAANVSLEHLGRVRQAWATSDNFGLYGGDANPVALRRRIAEVKAELAATTNPDDREHVRQRLGKLLGGVAILYVGALTPGQQEARKALAQRTVTALRLALGSGVAPGGGAAYLACQRELHGLTASTDERVAFQALTVALEEPLAVIAANAGFEPKTILAQVKASPPWHGFDALTGGIVDMWPAGIVDPVSVLQTALEKAVSGAVMTLSSDVLVHRSDPLKQARP
jgi:chaperonin GroEL